MSPALDWHRCYRGRRVVVLGAGGYIGRRLAARLTAGGAEVIRVVRPGGTPSLMTGPEGGRTLEVELSLPGEATTLLRTQQPAITFNMAGYGVSPAQRDADLSQRINADLPAELCLGCGAAAPADGWPGLRLVHAGSALEYGVAPGDLEESTPPLPTTLYGRTKLAGTLAVAEAVQAGRLRGVTARLFTVYGPGESAGRLLPSLLAAAGRAEPIPLTAGTQWRDFTFLDDVTEGLLRLGALVEGPPATVNLATGVLTSVREFATRAAAVIGLAPDQLHFGALPTRPEEMAHDPVNVARLAAATGWTPSTTIEAGVSQVVRESGSKS
ncbi:MAG: NAD(P)-dependent oxidoreductase [Actinomycetota bacterium]|nr:NAD(P)-dependent oxidoreductase [Actinomycetota bacterium]